jgi:glycine cleavage system regulatory protein
MLDQIVLSFIGADKPGLVKRLADIISSKGGNWMESNLSQLAGKFTGIVLISVSAQNSDSLCKALHDLSSEEFKILTELTSAQESAKTMELALHILGPDRPGIVKSISQALEQNKINVKQMESKITSAAMSGDPMFEAEAIIQVADQIDIDALLVDINNISMELGIDIDLS